MLLQQLFPALGAAINIYEQLSCRVKERTSLKSMNADHISARELITIKPFVPCDKLTVCAELLVHEEISAPLSGLLSAESGI